MNENCRKLSEKMSKKEKVKSVYRDRRFKGDDEDYKTRLSESTTLYIGNMSFYTNEDQIYTLFSMIGPVQKVVMGINRVDKTPCGYCFVIYYMREHAETAIHCLNGRYLDDRPIRVDIDAGFYPGRQYGRGRSGGQLRDEFRPQFDDGRGGYGKQHIPN